MKWEKLIQSGPRMPYYMNLYVRGSFEDVEKITGLKYTDNFVVLDNQINTVYFDSALQKRFEESLKVKIVDRNFHKKFISTFKDVDKELLTFCNKLRRLDYSEFNTDDLIVMLKTFSKLFKAKFGIYGLPVVIDMAMVEILPTALSSEVSKEDLMFLTGPVKQSEYTLERKAFIEIVLKIKEGGLEKLFFRSKAEIMEKLGRNWPHLHDQIERYSIDYDWVGLSHHIQQVTIDDVIENLREGLKDESLEDELRHINGHDVKKEKDRIMGDANFSRDDMAIFSFISQVNEIKESRKVGMCKSVLWSYPLFQAIARALNTNTILLRQLVIEEMEEVLERGALTADELDMMTRRLNYYVCIMKEGNISNKESDEARQLCRDELEEIDYSDMQEVKGSPAQKGVVQGVVRLIMSEYEMKNLVSGEILVTSMTDPNMVPVMKKAGAIVTDEGGITCHAAIVSRELKKPCVTGTKIATKVFQDGDIVEVNANSGYIKKINR